MEARVLKINLSNRSFHIEEIPRDILRKFIGGRGLGSYLLYQSVPARVDSFSEQNHLIFTSGPAGGTTLPYGPKTNMNTKSPLTDIYLFSIASGILGHQMRKAGFWAIDVEGISESPVYIAVKNQQVSFHDAHSLWGSEPAEAQRAMLGDQNPKNAATVAIGPAGEQLVRYAAVFTEGAHLSLLWTRRSRSRHGL